MNFYVKFGVCSPKNGVIALCTEEDTYTTHTTTTFEPLLNVSVSSL